MSKPLTMWVQFSRSGMSRAEAVTAIERSFGDAIGVLGALPTVVEDRGLWIAKVEQEVDRDTYRALRELDCCKDFKPWPSNA